MKSKTNVNAVNLLSLVRLLTRSFHIHIAMKDAKWCEPGISKGGALINE